MSLVALEISSEPDNSVLFGYFNIYEKFNFHAQLSRA